ncbi:hypothetical protein HDU77_004612 [Chytriomyces hyalinus]|nr:hypothetical protein HDU77_004612 [Chytriomyces hyalinus]
MDSMDPLSIPYPNQKRDSSLTLTDEIYPFVPDHEKTDLGVSMHSCVINLEYPDQLSTVISIPSTPPPLEPAASSQSAKASSINTNSSTKKSTIFKLFRRQTDPKLVGLKPLSSSSYTNKIHVISNKYKLEGDESLFNKRDPANAILYYTKAIDMCLSPCPKILARYDRVNTSKYHILERLKDPLVALGLISRTDVMCNAHIQPCVPPSELFVLRAQARTCIGDYTGAWDDCDVVVERVFELLVGSADGDCGYHDPLAADVALSARLQRALVRRLLGDASGALNDYQALQLHLSKFPSKGHPKPKTGTISQNLQPEYICALSCEVERGIRISSRLALKQIQDREFGDLSCHANNDDFHAFREGRVNYFTLQDSGSSSDSEEQDTSSRIHLTHRLRDKVGNLLYHTLLPGIIFWRENNAFDFDRRELQWAWDSVGILDPGLSDAATSLSRLLRMNDSGTKPGIKSLFRILGGFKAIYDVGVGPSNVHLVLPILAASVSASSEGHGVGANTLEMSAGGRLQSLVQASFAGTCGFDVEHEMTEFIAPLVLRLLNSCFQDEACLETVIRECQASGEAVRVWGQVFKRLVGLLEELADDLSCETGGGAVYQGIPHATPSLVLLTLQIICKVLWFDQPGRGHALLHALGVDTMELFLHMASWLDLSESLLDGESLVAVVCQCFIRLLEDGSGFIAPAAFQIALDALGQISDSTGDYQEDVVGLIRECSVKMEDALAAAKEQSKSTEMQLTFKTLQQTVFTIEAEASLTVAQVKGKIAEAQGFAAENQKLIFAGKILSDDATIEGSKISEKDFIVCMVTKPKAAPAPAPVAAPAPAPVEAAPAPPVAAAAPAPVSEQASVAQPPAAAAAPAAALSTTFDASTLATGPAYQAAVQNLIEMGFPAEQVARAMKAAYNNPDRAAEYLMTGIPDNIESLAPPATPAPRSAQAAATTPNSAAAQPAPAASADGYVNLFEAGAAASRPGTAAGAGAAGAPAAADLEQIAALRNSPEFQQFRQLIAAQPQLLQPMLQQLGQSQPELLRIIQQNPDAFLQILTGGDGSEGAMDFGDDDDEGGALPPGTIQVTPEENAAIERLTALGFDRNLAAQAYFACDKNEELAANYLFENGGDW